MQLAREENIAEVIAFLVNNRAIDVMTSAPSEIAEERLRELRLRIEDSELTT